jgi:DNA excision repair protein ERCC-4
LKNKNFRIETKKTSKRKLNEVPDFLKKKRRIAIEQKRCQAYGNQEDREREAVLDEAIEETEHRLDMSQYQSTKYARRDMMVEGDRLEDHMFNASFFEEPRVILKSLTSIEADGGASLLQDTMPDYVILYEADITFIRALEVYSALNCSEENRLKIYFLTFSSSAEDKVFKKSLEREQNAFERLIHHKQTMPPPVFSITYTQECQQAAIAGDIGGTYNNGTLPLAFDTRRGSHREDGKAIRRDIAVDVREFRSALPSILHQGGMRLAPVTLTVGDFVLSSVHW